MARDLQPLARNRPGIESLFDFQGPESASSLQNNLSKLVQTESDPGFDPRLVCGLDAAYRGEKGVGTAALVDLLTREVLEVAYSEPTRVAVEYAPGLFGFREGPLVVDAASKLKSSADVFLVDGHGVAHPRRFGLACHVGLALGRPTVGVARSRLTGRIEEGSIIDEDGTILGKTVNEGRNLLFVSMGHKIGLEDAVKIVKDSSVGVEYPQPLRLSHQKSVELARKLDIA